MKEQTADRHYRSKIHSEDLLLYIIAIVLILFFSYFFLKIQERNDNTVFTAQDQRMFENLKLSDKKDSVAIEKEFIKAQLQLVYKRYELSTKVSRTIAYIKFIGFLIGTLLVLLGTMLVIRGVRDHAISGTGEGMNNFKFSLAVSSPGMFLTLIGAIIMVATIIKGIENKMEDTGIAFPNVVPYKTTSTDDTIRNATITNVKPSN